nr:uncharacterized protein LOC106690738 [Halyomorpha halys]
MKGANKFENEKIFLQKVFQKIEPGSEIISIDGSAACSVGDNYMSNVFRFNISLQDGNNNICEKHLLVKKLPTNEIWREAFGCELAFRNEAISYNVVVEVLNKFRGEDKLPMPTCFHASVQYTVLEDLKPLGFRMVERQLGLDLNHAKHALKELGKFHGTSMAMKHSQPKLFADLISNIQEIAFLPEKEGPFVESISVSVRMATVGLKVLKATGSDCFEASLNKIQTFKQSAYMMLLHSIQQRGKLSVICHGDFYLNNIMFNCIDDDTFLYFLSGTSRWYTNVNIRAMGTTYLL